MSLLIGLMLALPATAQEYFGPFGVSPEFPRVMFFNGQLGQRTPLHFRRALKKYPDTNTLIINSPGGLIYSGLLIAEEVHDRGMATVIPEGRECSSACALIFFAGTARMAAGRLGVHQITTDTPGETNTPETVADIREALQRYQIPPEVLAIMLRTPPDQIHYFSADEMKKYGLDGR